jgi:hypothetical protein
MCCCAVLCGAVLCCALQQGWAALQHAVRPVPSRGEQQQLLELGSSRVR